MDVLRGLDSTAVSKPRTRLWIAGQATYRLVARDRGWGGAWGQDRRPAKWACIDCGRRLTGTDDQPSVRRKQWSGEWDEVCARNGHAPCRVCGKVLPRLNDGCPREHNWRLCPGKNEPDRMAPQHAAVGHRDRSTL